MHTERSLGTLEILGTALCLDFANTINSRVLPVHEYLRSYSDLATWACRAGGLTAEQEARLRSRATQSTKSAAIALNKALTLRELLYGVFSDIAKGVSPKKENVGRVMDNYSQALSQAIFEKVNDTYSPHWQTEKSLNAIVWPIAYSAGNLLLSSKLNDVKECPGCGWLFVDRSKNQSRRWCNMDTCGARDKMRRYHKLLRSR